MPDSFYLITGQSLLRNVTYSFHTKLIFEFMGKPFLERLFVSADKFFFEKMVALRIKSTYVWFIVYAIMSSEKSPKAFINE